ncbi:AbrB/MazE/SpoVT family DNA-binding domain-containing protein [uncultured Tyzzerella sp.]|uniref:AbrB/MazE/SpoVT family DNA-binding domain-containing protein n=1 Tax=uncultured Tyzzerella sp. TaxID=2321398 RepID=UPI002942BC88|nr:AbrB/MazE/SpoVT family DNA-binding domain-containing protein [uncultured Tyzzerella sp.]
MYLGIRRRLDDLGRIVIPVEMRKSLNIENKDLIDIRCENGAIILTPILTLDYNKIKKIKDYIKDLFGETNLYITDNNKILYSNFENEIGSNLEEVIHKIPKDELRYFENILVDNTEIGSIYLSSKYKIPMEQIKLCKLLAHTLN